MAAKWKRRDALKLAVKGGLPFGVLAGAGLSAGYTFLPPKPSQRIESVDRLAVRLFESLNDQQRADACVEYDHPLRQYHNRGVAGGGRTVSGWDFDRMQRSLLTDLVYAGLSEAGRRRLPRQFFIDWSGVQSMRLLICGDPRQDRYQIVLTGPHLNLRLGGSASEGVAFGGPMVYGDQRGNERQGLPGNVYRYQLVAAQLFRQLEPHQQRESMQTRAPIQTQIELQGDAGHFAGIEVAQLSRTNRAQTAKLVEGILSTYAQDTAAYAHRCLQNNGGIERLRLSYYADGKMGNDSVSQIFRLEGPAAVIYFRGAPHLHAFI
ncbi:MAG: DUF3500 domain-containing protein, partial [Myxococcota bacterium]